MFKLKIEDQSQIKLAEKLKINKTHLLKGLFGSGISMRFASEFRKSKRNFLFTLNDAEQAAYFFNDQEHLGNKDNILFFPSSHKRSYSKNDIDNSNVLQRSFVLKELSNKKPKFIVTYPEAIFEKIISKKTLKKNTLHLKKGMNISLDFLNESLFEFGFERVDFVCSPGDFSVRGGIIDVYSYSNQHPYRIEFFSDTINSLRTFDVKTQLSISSIDALDLIPNTSSISSKEERKTLIDLLPKDSVLITMNVDKTVSVLNMLYEKTKERFSELSSTIQSSQHILYSSSVEWINTCKNFCHIILNRSDFLIHETTIKFVQKPQPIFNKNFELLVKHFNSNHKSGILNYILCTNSKQVKRLNDIFQEMDEVVHYKILECPIHAGFEDMESKIAFFTDHQIFGRYHKYKLKSDKIKRDSINLKELTNLQIGDYVTHIDHGIGKFGGLQTIRVGRSKQEAVKVIYGDGDILYISIHSLHKISKFNGKDGHKPKIYKLGSKSWKILKQKTKSKLKSLAFDLIKLYAKRKEKIGYAFSPDSYLQWELEASFLFEDTPDQTKATKEIKLDMESERTMDRLVCGDVGFGKTEVAIRAAFKAVDNSKQVAILVPTTILSFQHYKTFTNRLKDFPLRIDYLNRFRPKKEKEQIYKDLSDGKIDIIIGTHQLTNKSIIFNDLGLLIVDEEQKFGVSVKESIRSIKNNIDVLSLTATPIPRTLQFSLMSARDLSIIATPPPNRFPIETEIIRLNETLIRDAIIFELQRGGQIFFIHNRVENINEVGEMLQRLIPDAKISIGHGQMDGNKLERRLIDFMEGESDILVATTIIENGLDVPNANTIFINNANNFGLSDLHQMRGRVGRSNKKAFCYFITPPINHISNEAQKRINAIQNYSELGSGIQIAMKDLEIRGAGDLLGAEQSGFINEIGFETYHKILNEAVKELKENEFKELYENEESKSNFKDVQIDTDLEILFPDNYINIISERLSLYNELSKINDRKDLLEFKKKIIDRFGPLPEEAEELIKSVDIKRIGSKIGIEKFIIKQDKCLGYFIQNEEDDIYKNPTFINFLNNIQNKSSRAIISKKKTKKGMKLILTVEDIKKIDDLLNILENLIKDSSGP